MITRQKNPLEWASFIFNLAEAQDHLTTLIKEINETTDYDETDLRIDLGHVMAHLNRAWACRNIERPITEDEWHSFREYDPDLKPIA